MAVIYLKHPRHGTKVASSEMEAVEDRKNGWVDFDPTASAEPAEVDADAEDIALLKEGIDAANAEAKEALEAKAKAEAERDEVKADLKEAKAELKKAEAALKKAEGELEKAKAKAAPSTPPGTVPDFLKPEG